jgi:hypothetical protein
MYCGITKDKTIYGAVIRSVVMCGLEVGKLSKGDENTLEIWKRKILRKIIGPVKEIGVWKIHTNQGLLDLCGEVGIISEVSEVELRWLGIGKRMPKKELRRKCLRKSHTGKKSSFRRPRKCGWTTLKWSEGVGRQEV